VGTRLSIRGLAPRLVMAFRGFFETTGGSRNFVPARAALDPAITRSDAVEKDVDASRGFYEIAGGRGDCVPPRARIKSGHVVQSY
jgi:hypothetical protein